jgi:hypothetical protein
MIPKEQLTQMAKTNPYKLKTILQKANASPEMYNELQSVSKMRRLARKTARIAAARQKKGGRRHTRR